MTYPIVKLLREEASRDIPDDLSTDTIGWLKYAADFIEQMAEALEEINMRACYASEEDTASREQMLLDIGDRSREALRKLKGE